MYSAILDERMATTDPLADVEPLARAGDDRAVFTTLALALLHSVEDDPSILRLLLYSALEGHELSSAFQEKRIRGCRLRDFLARYIARRTRAGAFRKIAPALGARAFMGMIVDHSDRPARVRPARSVPAATGRRSRSRT